MESMVLHHDIVGAVREDSFTGGVIVDHDVGAVAAQPRDFVALDNEAVADFLPRLSARRHNQQQVGHADNGAAKDQDGSAAEDKEASVLTVADRT
jgi:hypothetical protein